MDTVCILFQGGGRETSRILTFTESIPCARLSVKPFMCLFLFNPQDDFMKLVFYSHLNDEGSDAARRGRVGMRVHAGLSVSAALPFSLTVSPALLSASV